MSHMLRIQLLGEFCLLDDGRLIHGLNKPRQQALLAYLLLHRHTPQSRQHLAFCFWPDSTESQAHTNLRKLFFQLRQTLPEADRYLLTDAHALAWRTEALYALDVAELEQLLDALEQEPAPSIETIQRVGALYAGKLLPSCYDDWVLPLRRALHERVVHVLEKALVSLEVRHEYQAGLHTAEYLLRLDPLHEPTYLHLMRFRAHTGDRTAALKAYHECVNILAQELGVPPASETQLLYQQLLTNEIQPAPKTNAAQPSSQPHVPLVGRAAEWQILRRALNERVQRGPHLLMVWGEAGVGKTRLVEELIHWARLQPGSVAYARAYAAEGTMAYAPIIEWLRSDALRPELLHLDALWRAELERLLPELMARQSTLPAPQRMSEGWQLQRFYEAMAHAVLAAPTPLLLVLDDMQWCDGETFAWLRFLLRFRPHAPLLVVGTARSESFDPQHPLPSLRQALQRAGQWSDITLATLTALETTVLAGHLAQGDAADWAEALYRETEGNPLFVVEMVQAGFAEAAAAGQTVALPQTVQAVIEERLSRLTPQTHQLAQLAATIGRGFTVEELAVASGFGEDMLVMGLDELWRHRIVREQGERYDFSHDKIREVAYRQASVPRRRSLHQHVGSALALIYAGREDEVAGELAVHAEQVGHIGHAIEYLERAARVEQSVGAYADAVVRLRRALHLIPSLPLPAEDVLQRELALLTLLGTCLLALRGYGDSEVEAVYQRAHAVCAQLADDPQLMPILVGLASFYLVRGELRQALAIAEQALQLAERVGDDGLLVEAHGITGIVLQYLGEFQASIAHLEQALSRYDTRLHSVHAIAYGQEPGVTCLVLLSISLWQAGYADRSLEKMREAQALARAVAHPYTLTFAQTYVAHLYHLRQEPAAAEMAASVSLDSAHRYGLQYWLAIGAIYLHWAKTRLAGACTQTVVDAGSSAADHVAQLQAAINGFKGTGAGLVESYYLGIMADAEAAMHRPLAALATLEKARRRAEQNEDFFWLAELQRLRGEFLLALLDVKQREPEFEAAAEVAFLQALQTARTQQAHMLELRATTSLARLWLRQGRRENAYESLKSICNWFTEGWNTPDLQAATTLLAELA